MPIDTAQLTQALFSKTIDHYLVQDSIIFAALAEKNKMNWEGGDKLTYTVNKDPDAGNDLVQFYKGGNTPLTSGTAYPHDDIEFEYAQWQIPVEYDVTEYLENVTAGNMALAINIVTERIKNTHKWHNRRLQAAMYSTTSTAADLVINSIPLACGHDRTYAGKTTNHSSAPGLDYLQGASISGDYDDQSTDYGFTIDTIRQAYDAISRYDEVKNPLCLVGTQGWRELKKQAEGKGVADVGGSMLNYGFDSFKIEGIEIVKEKYLFEKGRHNELFMLDVDSWEFPMHKDRNFLWTDFTWDAKRSGGLDKWLARIMCMGQLNCRKPNNNIYLDGLTI